eukprot:COSAG06_NODE_3821_length_4873_cov_74.718894_5_plen_146_part_00
MEALETRMRDAAKEGDAAGVRACLEAGADPNAPDPRGRTAMHGAAVRGVSVEVLEVLHGAGAEVDKADEDGWTPLMYVAYNGATGAVLRWLLEQGADWRLQVPSIIMIHDVEFGSAKIEDLSRHAAPRAPRTCLARSRGRPEHID